MAERPPPPPPPPPRVAAEPPEFTVAGEACRDRCRILAGVLACVAERTGTVQPCDGGGWAQRRFTSGGEPCVFPLHTEGELFYDCIPLGEGVLGCKTGGGEWAECATVAMPNKETGASFESFKLSSPPGEAPPVGPEEIKGKISWGAIGALGMLLGAIALVIIGTAIQRILRRRRRRGGLATQKLRAAAAAVSPPHSETRSVQLSSMFSAPVVLDSIENAPEPGSVAETERQES